MSVPINPEVLFRLERELIDRTGKKTTVVCEIVGGRCLERQIIALANKTIAARRRVTTAAGGVVRVIIRTE